uniref:Uncharacterized protein n=1 Tax=Anguilla anguilla TaxID=7936 RepID=A0A0E9PIH9_ANGAN
MFVNGDFKACMLDCMHLLATCVAEIAKTSN